MAGPTLRAHRAMVGIICLVAAGTVLGQLRTADRTGMTGVTVHLLVLALERPVRLLFVVIPGILPFFLGMALLAVIAKSSAVPVVGAMAS